MADDPLELLKRAPAPAMDVDENAVLSGGRRRQRRRRLAQLLASTLTVAGIALGGWWVARPAEDRSLPGGPSSSAAGPSVTMTTGADPTTLRLALPGTSGPSPQLLVRQDGLAVNLAVATPDGAQSEEVGALLAGDVGERGAALRFQAYARPLVLLVTDRAPTAVRLDEADAAGTAGSPWGSLAGHTASGMIPTTTLWATLIDPSARPDLSPGSVWWSSADGTTGSAAVTDPTPASTATASATGPGGAPDNVLRSGVAEEVATTNTPYLPVATERLRATVTVAAAGSATGRVTPVAGPDEGTVSLEAGGAGAFVLPGVKDATVQTAHVYGLVRAGAGELTITGTTAPAHWSTSTFPVEGADVVLVVVTVPVTSGAGPHWTISWQSVDGGHSVPVVGPGG